MVEKRRVQRGKGCKRQKDREKEEAKNIVNQVRNYFVYLDKTCESKKIRERERKRGERCTYILLHIYGRKKESAKEQRLQEKEEERGGRCKEHCKLG